jgi:signal transduction histidine kinase
MSGSTTEHRAIKANAVLIIADNADFTRDITARWLSEHSVPAFTLMSGDLCPGIHSSPFDLAIVGAVPPGVLPSVLTILETTGKPVVFIAADAQNAETVRETHTRVLVLRQREGWLDALMLLVGESLRCADLLARAVEAEERAAASEKDATLGRYMLDMRHALNDALTSVLGNSELALLAPGALSSHTREQLETIRNMAFRMHEILQRFSSLESELRYMAQQSANENRRKARGAAAST